MSINEEFTFTWTIENFKICPQKNGHFLRSPFFKPNHFLDTCWCLILYPRGTVKSSTEDVSCYLYRSNHKGPESIWIDFTISINNIVMKSVNSFFNGIDWGWKHIIRRNVLKQANVCVIECHMRRLSSSDVEVNDTKYLNRYLDNNFFRFSSMESELMKDTCLATKREVNKVLKSLQPYSNQCFVRTRIFTEQRIFTGTIDHHLYLDSKRRQYIPVTLTSANLVLVLCIITENNFDFLKTEIRLEKKEKWDFMLICKIELRDSERQICEFAENEYLLDKNKNKENWEFEHFFKLSNLKEKCKANLRFTITLSDERYFSDIQWTAEENNAGFPILPNNNFEDLHRMFIEKKFCDVTIRTKDKLLYAHKIVLCSKSPVFTAMFESGLKESITNEIHIDDLDSDTVSQMLHFMYTEKVEDLNIKNATQLYVTADRYQITSLKDICRHVLTNNITEQNICSVLSLADLYQDDDLSKHAIHFLFNNENYFLKSKQWKEFEENNIHLALDTLKKVYMKFLF